MKETTAMIKAIRAVPCPVNPSAHFVIEAHEAEWRIGWRHQQEFYPLQSGETLEDAAQYSYILLQHTGHIPRC
jgi:hypothetical protein